jgi:hypothetical protein
MRLCGKRHLRANRLNRVGPANGEVGLIWIVVGIRVLTDDVAIESEGSSILLDYATNRNTARVEAPPIVVD